MVVDHDRSVEVTDAAMEAFDAEILEATSRTVWDEDCQSWYKNDAGRITNNWPDYTINYARRMRRPDLDEWRLEPA
jgi:hypothetical protein